MSERKTSFLLKNIPVKVFITYLRFQSDSFIRKRVVAIKKHLSLKENLRDNFFSHILGLDSSTLIQSIATCIIKLYSRRL